LVIWAGARTRGLQPVANHDPDFADAQLAAAIYVAEIPALILAKRSKVGERIGEPRKGAVRDKDFGDLWRLMAVADPGETARVIAEFLDQNPTARQLVVPARQAGQSAAHRPQRRSPRRGWVTRRWSIPLLWA
jgi:hypothetical protein